MFPRKAFKVVMKQPEGQYILDYTTVQKSEEHYFVSKTELKGRDKLILSAATRDRPA